MRRKKRIAKPLETAVDKVQYLLRSVPATCNNQVLLLLLYWKMFDDIDIPADLVRELATKATLPETIFRSRRFAVQNYRMLLDIIASITGRKEEPAS